MRRGLILLALALLVPIIVAAAPSTDAFVGGQGSGIEQYDCGSSCHVTPSTAVVTMFTPSLTVEKGGLVTVTVSVSGGNSGPILGVMLVATLNPDPTSIPSAAGWTITTDPSGSGTDNYYEITSYAGLVSLQWSLTAPQIDGNFSLFARVQHGVGGEAQFANNEAGLSFLVGAGGVSGVPVVDIISPLDWQSVEGVITVNVSIQSSTPIAYALLQIDGVVVNNKSQEPFRWDVNTTEYANGEHSLNITAYDANGSFGHKEITVNVNNPVAKKANYNWAWMAVGGVALIIGIVAVALFMRKASKAKGVSEPKLSLTERELLAPLLSTKLPGYALLALCMAGVVYFVYMWYYLIISGHVATGMRDYGVPLAGTPWGIYIVSFIWLVGIAHGGIVISASIRVLKFETYKPVARMAEVLTCVMLLMAGLTILMDLGRPDRIDNVLRYYWSQIGTSPFAWDLTVILLYTTLSVTYLYLLMREDLAYLRDRLPKFKWIYNLLLFGYRESEKKKIDQISWWIAMTLLVLVALLSGGVIPWIFSLIAAQAGWFGAIQGPYYLIAALSSGIASVIVIAAIMRTVFKWEKYIRPEIFTGLGKVLGILVLIYLWFVKHEQLTMQFAAPRVEHEISTALLTGEYAVFFWPIVASLLFAFAYLELVGTIFKKYSILGTTITAVVILVAFWVKRFLIVIPSLRYPRLELYPVGTYTPSLVEYSMVLGTLVIAVFLFVLFMKVFPIMDVKESETDPAEATAGDRDQMESDAQRKPEPKEA
jgi:molybdopterin-containing oxidoreductase family membrane subunit